MIGFKFCGYRHRIEYLVFCQTECFLVKFDLDYFLSNFMGHGSSRDRNTVEFNSIFNSDGKSYFVIYPEEQIVDQNFC